MRHWRERKQRSNAHESPSTVARHGPRVARSSRPHLSTSPRDEGTSAPSAAGAASSGEAQRSSPTTQPRDSASRFSPRVAPRARCSPTRVAPGCPGLPRVAPGWSPAGLAHLCSLARSAVSITGPPSIRHDVKNNDLICTAHFPPSSSLPVASR